MNAIHKRLFCLTFYYYLCIKVPSIFVSVSLCAWEPIYVYPSMRKISRRRYHPHPSTPFTTRNILWCCMEFYMVVKLGLSLQGKNTDWLWLRTGCWEEYISTWETGLKRKPEDSINRSLTICTLSPNIIKIRKLRRVRWAGNIARIRKYKYIQNFNLKTWSSGCWRWDLKIDLEKYYTRMQLGSCGMGEWVACSCEHDNVPSGSIKAGKFVDEVTYY
jgi:hypothetical protein